MMALAVLLLSFAGFALLALSMRKHHVDLMGRPPSGTNRLALRVGGWTVLAGALALAILGDGLSIGVLLWLGFATVAALAVAMGLTYSPRARPGAAGANPGNDRTAARPKAESIAP